MAPPAAAAATQSSKKRKSSKGKFDPFIGSKFVTGLDLHIYQEFLKEKDAALVMFYDPAVPQCDWSRKHFLRAAKTTERPNHAYAAVNCIKEKELCDNEQVNIFPFFKLFTRGKLISTYGKPQEFLYYTMKKFVETVPVVTEAGRPKRPC